MKNSRNLRKALTMVCCAMLLVAISVGATVAYLTDKDAVTNTFTVGNIDITLDETDVDKDGVKDGETPVKTNEYRLLPNHEYIKDPTVHVTAASEDCYVFVQVENGIADIEDQTNTIAAQILANGWTLLTSESVDGDVYWKVSEYVNDTTIRDLKVFGTFKIDGTVDNETLAEYASKTIDVTAYAIQKDGFDTADAAWASGIDSANGGWTVE